MLDVLANPLPVNGVAAAPMGKVRAGAMVGGGVVINHFAPGGVRGGFGVWGQVNPVEASGKVKGLGFSLEAVMGQPTGQGGHNPPKPILVDFTLLDFDLHLVASVYCVLFQL